jgi:DHA2 family multidrug resistance protein
LGLTGASEDSSPALCSACVSAGAKTFFFQHTGDSPLPRQMTLQALERSRNQQALAPAYFAVFWVSGVIAAILIFLVLLMRRSVAEKGAHVGAE